MVRLNLVGRGGFCGVCYVRNDVHNRLGNEGAKASFEEQLAELDPASSAQELLALRREYLLQSFQLS